MGGRVWARTGAVAGLAGPVLFTAGWVVASLRQTGHSATQVQLSGLAAPDARDPGIMIAAFVVLGVCCIAFGGSLHSALAGSRQPALGGPPRPGPGKSGRPAPRESGQPRPEPRRAGPGPRLIQCAGLLTIAAGLLRRDHMMLTRPGAAGESWHNHAHDVVSAIVYVMLVAAPLLLAARFRRDPDWRPLWVPLVAGSALTAGFLGVFVSGAFEPSAGILQRIAVTIPLVMLAAVAGRLLAMQTRGAVAPRGAAGPLPAR